MPDLSDPRFLADVVEPIVADGIAREQWHIAVGALIVAELRRIADALEAQ